MVDLSTGKFISVSPPKKAMWACLLSRDSRSANSTLSRAQVVAEAREAQRLGLTQGGEVQRFATPSQLESIARAGSRSTTT